MLKAENDNSWSPVEEENIIHKDQSENSENFEKNEQENEGKIEVEADDYLN